MPDRPDAPTLILASRSPRRAQLLRDAGYQFQQADPPFEDPPQPTDDRRQPAQTLAVELAEQKALSLHGRAEPGSVILAADTICVGLDGRLIGQPRDRDDAKRMIQHFTEDAHQVVTGIALMPAGQDPPILFSDQARVILGTLSAVQLDQYLDTDQWQGKAGGYNLFDRQAAGWPLDVQGDPATVVGLPMQKLVPALAQLNIQPQQAAHEAQGQAGDRGGPGGTGGPA